MKITPHPIHQVPSDIESFTGPRPDQLFGWVHGPGAMEFGGKPALFTSYERAEDFLRRVSPNMSLSGLSLAEIEIRDPHELRPFREKGGAMRINPCAACGHVHVVPFEQLEGQAALILGRILALTSTQTKLELAASSALLEQNKTKEALERLQLVNQHLDPRLPELHLRIAKIALQTQDERVYREATENLQALGSSLFKELPPWAPLKG